jgi:hypothetical protein
MCFEYARNSYRYEFFEFLSRSCSLTLPHTSSCVLPQFSHGPNHRSYGLVHERTGLYLDALDMPGFSAGASHTHLELRHLDGSRFLHRGSRPTQPNDEVERTVKTSSGHMVKCWIPKIYLTNPSTESSTFSRPM